jgi:uncharacterized membrane protein
MVYVLIIPISLFPIVYIKTTKAALKQAFLNPNFILLGLFYGLMIMCHLNAIVLIEVPYMISLKRTSLLFSIIYGRLIFQEKAFFERLTGGLLMIGGILLITLL